MSPRAAVGLGANLGDRLAALQRAVDELADSGRVVAVSAVYETAPVGGPAQPDFLNAVVVVETSLPADQLLGRCQRIEHTAGRVRGERWGPRVLDLDLIAYDDAVSVDPLLTLPHPRAAERAFVLVPWLDADPDATLDGLPLRRLIEELDSSGVRRTDHVLTVGAGRRPT
ncbi:MAG TPA: 2-amino-4-hydroxy-6-hydroxymethyldihydropteridine diphosphokinase [Mycobacteriales bacterium]|nr:2-amino-4-hydroxy-6-hydroxymethyldihydropteridine diphosphokinase [Mycobacteriales bacterium]